MTEHDEGCYKQSPGCVCGADKPLTEQEVRELLGVVWEPDTPEERDAAMDRLMADWQRLAEAERKEFATQEALAHHKVNARDAKAAYLKTKKRLAEAEQSNAALKAHRATIQGVVGRAEQAERERDEWKSRAEAMYQTEVGYTVALLESRLAEARAALEQIESHPTTVLNPEGEDQAAHEMALIARDALATMDRL